MSIIVVESRHKALLKAFGAGVRAASQPMTVTTFGERNGRHWLIVDVAERQADNTTYTLRADGALIFKHYGVEL